MNARFRSGICRVTRIGRQAFDGANVDDVSLTPLPKVRHCCLRQQEWGLEIDVHHLIPVRLSHLLDGLLEHDPGVVHQNVQATKAFDNGLDG